MPNQAHNVTRSGDNSYILVNFILESEVADPADEGALQKWWVCVLPQFSRDGYGFEEDWAEVYTGKIFHQKATQSAHQSWWPLGIPFRLVMP